MANKIKTSYTFVVSEVFDVLHTSEQGCPIKKCCKAKPSMEKTSYLWQRHLKTKKEQFGVINMELV